MIPILELTGLPVEKILNRDIQGGLPQVDAAVDAILADVRENGDEALRKYALQFDGVALDEPYTMTPTNNPEGRSFPLVVEEGCIFVMGDNRNASKDSRDPEIGQIDRREILGKVVFLFFPGTNKGTHKLDFGRIGVVS